MGTELSKWVGWTDEQFEEDIKFAETRSEFFKPAVGKHRIRLLPAPPGERPLVVTFRHFVQHPHSEIYLNVNCPRRMTRGQQGCPICDFVATSVQRGKLKNDAEWRESMRVYVNALIRETSNDDLETPAVMRWAFGAQIFGDIRDIRENGVEMFDPVNGHDLILTRRGTGRRGTKYSVQADMKASKIDIDAVSHLILPLSQYAKLQSYEELLAILKHWLQGGDPRELRSSDGQSLGGGEIPVLSDSGGSIEAAVVEAEEDEDVPF